MADVNLKKNILDLRYQLEIQKIHASLTMLTLGVLAFIGTFIWYLERIIFGIAISLLIILISLIFYTKTRRGIDEIIQDIEKLNKKA